MNEAAARRTVLLRAYEREPASETWSEGDRTWATRAAAQVEGERAADDAFVARRAALAIERLAAREKRVPRLLASVEWPAWIGWTIPALAVAAGAAADSIGAGKQVNLLSPPLLALLAWNLFVYLVILVRGTWGLVDERARGLGPIARLLARLAHVTGSAPKRGGKVAAEFFVDWMGASRRLTAARPPSRSERSQRFTCAASPSSTAPGGRALSSTLPRCTRCSARCSARPPPSPASTCPTSLASRRCAFPPAAASLQPPGCTCMP